MKILSIESSCDETSAAITLNGRNVLSNITYTQIQMHAEYGGVVPELASRKHLEKISSVVDSAIKEAKIKPIDIDAIAVTAGPGLIGALLTGLSFAKSVALALDKPLIPVHHIKGHIAANYIAKKELKPPFVAVVVSGGNTLFCDVKSYTDIKVLGKTRDDAAGECFDKIARVMGFPYPGGKKLDELARISSSNSKLLSLPKPYFNESPLDCSFSGLKTNVINYIHNNKEKNEEIDYPLLALSVSETIKDIIVSRAKLALEITGYQKIVLAGGVAANSYIREGLMSLSNENISVYIPPLELCGDNAAMIGCAGYYEYLNGNIADLKLNAVATISLEDSF